MTRNRIPLRLTVIYVLLCLVPTIVVSAFMIGWEQRQVNGEIRRRLQNDAVLLTEVFRGGFDDGPTAELQHVATSIAARIGVRITLVDRNGRVVADSSQSKISEVIAMDNHQNRPELIQAASSGEGQASRFSETIGAPLLYFAMKLDGDASSGGFVRTSMRISTIQELVIAAAGKLVLLAAVIGLVNLVMIYYAVTRFMNRLDRLRAAADAIAGGDYYQRVDAADQHDGGLGRAFNRMSSELATNVDSLRQRSEQLSTVLGGMIEGVIAIDHQQRVLFANRSAGGLLEFDPTQAAGKSLLETVRLQPLHSAAAKSLESGDQVQLDADIGSGVNLNLTIRATPLPGAPCPGVVLVILDVTDLRRLEGLRQEFIANVSHELKTPLSSIKAYAETLLNGALHDSNNNERFVQRISEQADRLHELILDMLSLARIESAQQSYEITPVPVSTVVEASLNSHRDKADSKSIRLVAQAPPEALAVKAEPEALRQILDNLVKNAVVYTGDGGTVTVCWERDPENPKMVAIRVSDTGIGIAEQHHARLFERFFRVDKARSREQGGTGLGLSIVKHLTQFFDGTVRVESELGKGTIFHICLPQADC